MQIAISAEPLHAADPLARDGDTVALWTFDSKAGADGQGSGGAIQTKASAGVAGVTGKFGNAVYFNGYDGKLTATSGSQIRIGGGEGFAIEAWVQVHKQGQTQPIVSAPPFVELEVRGNSGAVSFNLQSADGQQSVRAGGKINIVDGNWHHIAGVRDPQTKTVRVYVDGVLDVEVDDATAGKELLIADTFTIGSNASGTETLGGTLDSLRISKSARAISAQAADDSDVERKAHLLENDHVRLTFHASGSHLSLAGLFDKKRGVEFVTPDVKAANLWQASMRSDRGMYILSDEAKSFDVQTSRDGDGQRIVFTWQGLAIGTEAEQVDITASVVLPDDSSMSDWRITIDNKSKTYGLWTAMFPRITNLAKLADDGTDVLAIPGGNGGGAGEGQIHPDPFKTLNHPFVRTYPCYHQSMQFNAYYNQSAGLYLATYDGEMHLKGFLLQPNDGEKPSMLYEVHHYPADSGLPGVGLKQNYGHKIATFGGDWYDACMIYREWALQQVWAQAGPLEQREDISPFLKAGAYWMVGTFEWQPTDRPLLRGKIREMTREEHAANVRQIDVDKSVELARGVSEYFGFPLLLWTNEWFDGGGDISPPRYIAQGGVDEYLRRVHDELDEVYVTGHMQMKRYSVQLAEFDDEVLQAIERTPNGEKAIEPLGAMDAGDQIGYPCWATPFWYDFWNAKAKSILTKSPLDGFHCDELASATSFDAQCFDRSHGHPIGGGTLYADTRRRNTKMLRDSARSVRPEFALHHEALSEIYLDLVDLAEVCTTPSNVNEPLFEAVYHDYAFVMGRRIHPWMDRRTFPMGDPKFGDTRIDEFVASFSQAFIWGNQPGWTRLDIVEYSPKVAAVIREFMQVRYRNMKFLNTGRFIRPLKETKPQEMITTIWTTTDTPENILPAILSSVWLASDGHIGIVLANTTDTVRTIEYTYDLAESAPGATGWTLSRTDGETPREIGKITGNTLTRSDEVPPRSVIVIEAAPQR